jgi:hypothetical protein
MRTVSRIGLFLMLLVAANAIYSVDSNFLDVQNNLRGAHGFSIMIISVANTTGFLAPEFKLLYLTTGESLLFLNPYTMYYSAMTITAKMLFGKLTIDPMSTGYVTSQMDERAGSFFASNRSNPLVDGLANETILLQAYTSVGNFSLCWRDPVAFRSSSGTRPDFFCRKLNDWTATPYVVRYPESVMTYLDVTFLIFQLIVTVGLVYHYVRYMGIIRRSRKFLFVTDSVINPPMWQALFNPVIPVRYLVKFRIWDSSNLFMFHVILAGVVGLSLISPQGWPSTTNGKCSWLAQSDKS